MNTQTTTTAEKTNSLVFKTSKAVEKEIIYVTIQLNDKCKNGHQDFSITGDIYKAGRPKTDSNHIAGGCIHDEIAKYFPEFKQFIKLHLCDYSGAPMHAGANGFYHIKNGFNNTPPTSPQFKNKFCDYYRVTPSQFDKLATAQNVIQFSLILVNLGVLEQWEKEAKAAINELERLTGKTFINDSIKGQFIAPTPAQIAEEEEKTQSGYYTEEATEARKQAKINAKIKDMEETAAKKIKEIKQELNIKKQLFIFGGDHFIDNVIFYKHTNSIKFNWKSYGKELSPEEIKTIKENLRTPKGSTFEN